MSDKHTCQNPEADCSHPGKCAEYDTDPCYCQQAQDYEDLLNRILETPKTLGVHVIEDALLKEIENTIGEYICAQAEYADEDDS